MGTAPLRCDHSASLLYLPDPPRPDSFSRVNMAKEWSGGSGSNRVSQGLGGGVGPMGS